MTLFWKDIKKNYDTRLPLAPMVDKCIDEKDICDMWQAHYKKLLNCLDSSKSKKSVERKLYSIIKTAIVFRPVDIFNALKSTIRLEKHVELMGLLLSILFILVQLCAYLLQFKCDCSFIFLHQTH